jgi:hypothetical protein
VLLQVLGLLQGRGCKVCHGQGALRGAAAAASVLLPVFAAVLLELASGER